MTPSTVNKSAAALTNSRQCNNSFDSASTSRTNLELGGAAILAVGTTTGTVAAGDDSRMTDSRTPTAHASSHGSGQGDEITVAQSQVTDLSTALAAKAPLATTVTTESGTSRTLAIGDARTIIRCTSESATSVTVPPNSSVEFVIGDSIIIRQAGAGQVTVVAGDGVTINTSQTLKTLAQHATVAITKVATDEWDMTGERESA